MAGNSTACFVDDFAGEPYRSAAAEIAVTIYARHAYDAYTLAAAAETIEEIMRRHFTPTAAPHPAGVDR